MNYLDEEINEFAKLYYGSPIIDDLIEMKFNLNTWYLSKEQQIKEYYWTRQKDDKLSLIYTYKTFKIRITFLNNGELTISFDHSYSHISNIADKSIKDYYYADPGYVYFIESKFGWKIGKTRDLDNRHKTFDVKLPFKFALRHFIKSHDITKLEIYFHELFKHRRINGEWFLITGDEIRKAVSDRGDLRIRTYSKDRKIIIEQQYLVELNEKYSVKDI